MNFSIIIIVYLKAINFSCHFPANIRIHQVGFFRDFHTNVKLVKRILNVALTTTF